MTDKIVTRFAPSPTGFMHIGGVRTALYAYLAAKQSGGTFILRIEDTDKAREVSGSIEHIQKSLEWLGIEWEFGPDKSGPFGSCIQSERLDIYKRYADQLVEKGLAYADPYTNEELSQFRAEADAEKLPFLYRRHRPENPPTWDGTQALRLKVPEIKRYEWHDAVRGDLSAGEEMLDDFIIMKADGYPTYNFAHIVDDHEMGVTHVMRGEEFIASMPKFLSLYDALEIPYPAFVTLPPILGPDRKKKLSKRDGAKDLLEYGTEGYLPEAMVNFLALIGWNPGTDQEIFTLTELIEAFSLSKIQKSGAAFDETKLLWMNKEHLLTLSDADYLTYLQPAITDRLTTLPQYSTERLKRLLPEVKDRIQSRAEFADHIEEGEYDFAFAAPAIDLTMVQWKNDASPGAAKPRLEQAFVLLESADFSSPDTIKSALWAYAEEVGRGELLWPLRVTLTGRERSPDPFSSAYIIGQEETLNRIKKACDTISGNAT